MKIMKTRSEFRGGWGAKTIEQTNKNKGSRLGKTHGLGHFEWEIPSLGHFEWEIPSRARAALCADFWSYIRVAQGENRKKKKNR